MKESQGSGPPWLKYILNISVTNIEPSQQQTTHFKSKFYSDIMCSRNKNDHLKILVFFIYTISNRLRRLIVLYYLMVDWLIDCMLVSPPFGLIWTYKRGWRMNDDIWRWMTIDSGKREGVHKQRYTSRYRPGWVG